jgi:hypothetical protein
MSSEMCSFLFDKGETEDKLFEAPFGMDPGGSGSHLQEYCATLLIRAKTLSLPSPSHRRAGEAKFFLAPLHLCQ